MSIESRLKDVEESQRLLRDANRLQGRPLSAEAPTHGDLQGWNATTKKWEPTAGVTIIDRDLDQVDVVSSTTETTLYSHSIPANTLGATGGIWVMVGGDMLVNTAGNLTLKIKLGSTTVLDNGALDIDDTADRYKWTLVVSGMNSTTGAQKWNALFQAVAGSDNFASQPGDVVFAVHMEGSSASTEDTTGALTFDVTATWSASSVSLSMRKETAFMELLASL